MFTYNNKDKHIHKYETKNKNSSKMIFFIYISATYND